MRKRYLREMVEDEVDAAQKHLQALYQSRLEVGPDFAALDAHRNHPKYAFWLEGIHRHLGECEAILAKLRRQRPDLVELYEKELAEAETAAPLLRSTWVLCGRT